MTNIQICVAYHKAAPIIKSDCLIPIQVGRACADSQLEMIGDDTGENISYKNFSYAELTGIYWIWKNSNAEIKGLLHYRRLLDLNKSSVHIDEPTYDIELPQKDNDIDLNKLGLAKNNIINILQDYDIITRKKEDLWTWSKYTVYSHYANEHNIKHLEKACQIIIKKYPQYTNDMKEIIYGHMSYFTNIIIARKDLFDKYCTFIFGILKEVEKSINPYERAIAPLSKNARWAGFLAERLTAIFIQHIINSNGKVFEAPLVALVPKEKKIYEVNTYSIDKQNKYNIIDSANCFLNREQKKPIVSVCIAAYNVEKTISKALNSVINQTLKNIEIIVVNDGSTDKTEEIVRNFQRKDKRIILINKKNEGLGLTRNVAISRATGKYIHLMDSDDWMDEDFLLCLVEKGEKYNSDLIITLHRGINEKTQKEEFTSYLPHTLLNKRKSSLIYNIDLLLVPCHVWDKLYRTDLIRNIPFTKYGGEDIFFWYRVIIKAQNVSFLRKCLYNYRLNSNSVQTKFNYEIGVFRNLVLTYKYLKRTKNNDYMTLFLIFCKVLLGHILYRGRNLIENNELFCKKLYKNTKLVQKRIKKTHINVKLLNREAWFWCDFKLVNTILASNSYHEFRSILNLNPSNNYIIGQIIKQILNGKRIKHNDYLEKLTKNIVYPIKYKFWKIDFLRITRKGNEYRVYILGILFLKISNSTNHRLSILYIPIYNLNNYKRKYFGIFTIYNFNHICRTIEKSSILINTILSNNESFEFKYKKIIEENSKKINELLSTQKQYKKVDDLFELLKINFNNLSKMNKETVDDYRNLDKKLSETIEKAAKQNDDFKKKFDYLGYIGNEFLMYHTPNIMYANNWEKNWIKEHFKKIDITYLTKINKLKRGLDSQSKKNIENIISRINCLFESNFADLSFFSDREIKDILNSRRQSKQVIRINDNIYQYKTYFLPINHFEDIVFNADLNLNLLPKICKSYISNKNIMDVGAFIGDSALILREFFSNNKIYCFEPNIENLNLLEKTIELNKLKNILFCNYALANTSQDAFISNDTSCSHLVFSENSSTKDFKTIKTITLDRYVQEEHISSIGLIKVDIEGAERLFLDGAINSIKKFKPILLISIYHKISDFFMIKDMIESLSVGYSFFITPPSPGCIVLETNLIAIPPIKNGQ